jgi:hypothetical protein
MKSYDDLVQTMGKQKASEFIVQNRSANKTAHEESRGIKGRIKSRYCGGCRKWVIEKYEYVGHGEPCVDRPASTKSKEFKPYFNMGLGCYVESRSEERRVAKSKGLIEAA